MKMFSVSLTWLCHYYSLSSILVFSVDGEHKHLFFFFLRELLSTERPLFVPLPKKSQTSLWSFLCKVVLFLFLFFLTFQSMIHSRGLFQMSDSIFIFLKNDAQNWTQFYSRSHTDVMYNSLTRALLLTVALITYRPRLYQDSRVHKESGHGGGGETVDLRNLQLYRKDLLQSVSSQLAYCCISKEGLYKKTVLAESERVHVQSGHSMFSSEKSDFTYTVQSLIQEQCFVTWALLFLYIHCRWPGISLYITAVVAS